MKKLIVAILALAPMAAFGVEEFPSYYPPSNEAPRACREGKTELFLETADGGEGTVYVYRTCRNGSFVQNQRKPAYRACREGKTELFLETSEGGEGTVYSYKTCRNGVWR